MATAKAIIEKRGSEGPVEFAFASLPSEKVKFAVKSH